MVKYIEWTKQMDNTIRNVIKESLNDKLINIIISNSTDKERCLKIKVRPVLLRDQLHYQVSEYIADKVYHTNYRSDELLEQLPGWFDGLFRQAEIITDNGKTTILISKKGKVTVINKIKKDASAVNASDEERTIAVSDQPKEALLHNKKKNYILQEGTPLPFLIDLGVMTKDGKVVKSKSDKFKQINRFLEYIEDILPYLNKGKELTILDFGCGKSYLTFAMYYYLKLLKGYHINIIGLDLKSDVIRHCNELSKKYGYDKLQFLEGDIASYTASNTVDMVVTLHACDTATDFALYKAVNWDAQVILSVPCCQHELNKQIDCDILSPLLRYGIIKGRMSALITDALRAELLETMGYRVQLLEFIDMEHTPKNILIRAVKRRNNDGKASVKKEEADRCMEFLGVSPSLKKLLQGETIEEGNKC